MTEARFKRKLVLDCGSGDAVGFMNSAHKFILPAIAGMTDWASIYFEIGKCEMGVPSNRDDGRWPQGMQQPNQERATSLTLLACVTTVGHRIARFVGMKRKDVPEKHRPLQVFEYGPNDCCGTFRDWRPLRRPRQRSRSEKIGVRGEVHFVCQCKARATTAAIAKITGYPNGVDAALNRRRENCRQIPAPNSRSIRAIMPIAQFGVWVEGTLELQCCNASNKVVDGATGVLHSEEDP